MTAQIPAANVAAAGTVSVAVQNPAPGGGSSNAASFAINPAGPTIGIVQTITQPISGTSPNASQYSPTINSDGQFVEFVSNSTNLTATDTNGTTTDIFRRTSCVGASAPAPCTPSTEIVSLTSAGAQGGVSSVGATVTGPGRYSSNDGRFTVFTGSVRDYANPPIQSNTQTVVLRDTCASVASGCTPSTSIQSLTDANAIASAMDGTLSGGGRVVMFRSGVDNVVSGVLSGNVEFPVYARDTCFGAPASPACVPTTRLVSASTAGALPAASPGNFAFVQDESISDDGRYVAFASNALNLAPSDTQNEYNVYLRDTCIGAAASCTTQTILVSENKNGGIPVAAPTGSEMPSMSSNGRYVLFWSDATDLVAQTTSGLEYYLRDTCLGVASGCTPATTLLTVDSNGNPLTLTSLLTTTQLISSNGRLVVFGPVPPIHPGDPAGAIYALDTCAGALAGCTPSSKMISVDGQGKPVPSLIASAISKDGHYAALADSSNFNIYLALTGY